MSLASRPRTTRLRAVVAATTLFAGLGTGLAATPAAAAGTVLQPGQTASEDLHLLANVPKRGAFAPETAFNSDMAFKDDYAFAGNYEGFTVYDIKQARKPVEVAQVVCPGSQNDISVHEDLLILSVDSRRNDASCNSRAATADESRSGAYWEGIRVFDISDPAKPEYVASVDTPCGSHTHTLVPNGDELLVYVSSYTPSTAIARCQPPHDAISIVEVPLATPDKAKLLSTPRLFTDGGLTPRTQGCHDITAYPAKGIAAGACMGEGVIIDITKPESPTLLERVADTVNFDFWHSATFNNAADTVIFTDELGGGGQARCTNTPKEKGANALYTLGADRQLTFASYYKMPREQAATENCVAHNGNLIPVKGKDIMVQAWYQGGISVFDFTDPKNPTELGFFDRGPLRTDRLVLGGSWSAYYYKGYIYSNDIQKGLDVLEMRDPAVANGKSGKYPTDYNPQSQPTY